MTLYKGSIKIAGAAVPPDNKTIVVNEKSQMEASCGASYSGKSTVIIDKNDYVSSGKTACTFLLPNGRNFIPGETFTISYLIDYNNVRGSVNRTVKSDGTIDSFNVSGNAGTVFKITFGRNTITYSLASGTIWDQVAHTTTCKITAAMDYTDIKPECVPVDFATIGKNLSAIFLMDGGVTFAKLAAAVYTSTIRPSGTATDKVLPTEAAVRRAIDSMGGGLKKLSVKNPALHPTDGIVTWKITHELGTEIIVQIFDKGGELVSADVMKRSATEVTVSWVSAEDILENTYEAVIIG